MCGITGSYPGKNQDATETMLKEILHRGPDGQGVCNTGFGVLGHARLAIIDPEHARQPLSANGGVIAFNGEIYNFRELAQKHLGGEILTTHSDTEVILRLYQLQGSDMVKLLDGMFAFAILDKGNLFLARDPLGIKPLYYGEHDGSFHFSSEIRSLATVCSSFKEFPPGCWYDSRSGWNRYYSLEESIQPFTGTETEAIVQIREHTLKSVQKRLLADVPISVSLSGGLDSSIITWCAKSFLDTLDTFAVGMTGAGDLEAARFVAKKVGTKHHERIYSEKDMLAVLPSAIRSLESFDPSLVRSAIPNFFLAELTSESVKVMLTGEGADELFAGYDYMFSFYDPKDFQQEMIEVTASLHNTNLQRADRLSMAFGLEARVPFLDVDNVAFTLGLPSEWKRHINRVPKYLLREAFRGLLPASIINRPKLKFSAGAGSSNIFATIAEHEVSDADFRNESARMEKDWNFTLSCKEALYYYRILRESVYDEILFSLMATSRSL